LLATLTACGKGEPETSETEVSLPVLYEVDGAPVSICEVEQTAHYGNVAEVYCTYPGFYDIRKQCALIASGTVSNIRDISITFISRLGYEQTEYFTLFELTIDEAFQSDFKKPAGKTVTFFTQRLYTGDEPNLYEGERYIIFGKSLENYEYDSFELKANGIADYILAHPTTLFIPYSNQTSEKFAFVFEVLSSEANASEVDADFIAEGKTYTLSDLEAYLRAKCK